VEKKVKELHNFCQNTKGGRAESYFERYYRNVSSPWFHEIKMKYHVFVSINCMRAGCSILKERLSRFNIVSTAGCDCSDRLLTGKHIFWDCKLYEDQRATIMDILSEESKKEYSKSVTRLLRLRGKKLFERRLLLHKQKEYSVLLELIN
jgi:hypothetical protein